MKILIPIVCSILFWLGGRDQIEAIRPFNQKLFRRLILPLFVGCIGIVLAVTHKTWLPLLTFATYGVSLNALSWGENHPLRKWFGKDIQWVLYGLSFGLSSFPVLGWIAIWQAIMAAFSCWFLMRWSNDGWLGNKADHQWVEIVFPFVGTILYLCLKL